MPSAVSAAPLTFDAFWRWLQDHRNCLVRAGAGEAVIFDHETLHWDFFDEPDGRSVVQAILGKSLLGEVVVERSDVLFVQASLDVEDASRGYWIFECMGGSREDNYPLYHFVMTHGIDTPQGHQALKH